MSGVSSCMAKVVGERFFDRMSGFAGLLGGLLELAGGFLEGGELGVGAQPCLPAGGEGLAGALAGEDGMEVAARYAEFAAGDGGAGVFGSVALVWGGFHFLSGW